MSLWTSIRDNVIKPVAAAYLAPMTGGTSLAVLAQSRAAAPPPQMLIQDPGYSVGMPGSGDSGGMLPTAAAVPPLLRGAAAAGRYLTNARGIVSTLTGRILGVMRGTQLFKNRQVAKLAREVGIQGAATALGISAVEVAQLIAADIVQKTRTRRGRGISARDIRTARRTIVRMNNFSKLIHCAPRRSSRATKAGTAVIRNG